MAYPIENKLVVAVSSSALFDLSESDKVYNECGLEEYRRYQEQNIDVPLAKGVAFPFVKRLLSFNEIFADEQPVEVVLLSRNSPETGLRVFRTIKHYGLDFEHNNKSIREYTYDLRNTKADFHTENMTPVGDGTFRYDIVCPDRTIAGCRLGVGGEINVENSVAAVAALWAAGDFNEERLLEALAEFEGVKRRFEVYLNTPKVVYIDDYAHHPEELSAAIRSIRGMFPERHLTVAFQPHLYTRTRDFAEEFSEALSMADRVLLLPIYPAREEPIEGVESQMLMAGIGVPCEIVEKKNLAGRIGELECDVVVTFGAGDIDRECDKVCEVLRSKC